MRSSKGRGASVKARVVRWVTLVGVAGALAVGLAGCGGDDGNKDAGGNPGTSTATVAPSGGGSTANGSTANGPSDADKKYVSGMCAAIKDFNAAMDKVNSIKYESGTELIKVVVGPFDSYAKAIAKITPPADLRDYHTKVVTDLNATAKALGEGRGLEGIDSLVINTAQLPVETEARLRKAAVGNADCKGSAYVP